MRQQIFNPGIEPFNVKTLMPNEYGCGDTVWNDMNLAPESITFDSLKLEIDQAFGGECDDSDDDEADDGGTSTTLFNYKEKSFTEDDITDFVSKSVVITIPDEMRERKCDACKQRFMLKESFDQHLKECIELKLNKFVMEGYQLLSMRKSRALSANEFNRRMIFALKKTVKSLTSCYKEMSEISSDDKITKKNNLFDACDSGMQLKKAINLDTDAGQLSSIRLPNLLSSLEGKPNVSIQKNHLLESGFNFSESADKCDSRINVALNSTPLQNQFKSIDNGNGNGNGYDDFDRRLLAHPVPKPQPKLKRRNPSELNTVVAQCSQCSQSFVSLQEFEEHIRTHYNHRSSNPSSNVCTFCSFLLRVNFYQASLFSLQTQSQSPSSVDEKNDTLNPHERNTLLQMLTNSTIKF